MFNISLGWSDRITISIGLTFTMELLLARKEIKDDVILFTKLEILPLSHKV